MSMPAWKEQGRKGKFVELARKKQFQKKRTEKKTFTYAPIKKEPDGPKKRNVSFEIVLK